MHMREANKPLKRGPDSVLIDVGTDYGAYCWAHYFTNLNVGKNAGTTLRTTCFTGSILSFFVVAPR